MRLDEKVFFGKVDAVTTIDLIRAAHAGDDEARNRLFIENQGLVWSIVKRFYGRGCESDDLFQIGSIGLIKAIDKFDLERELQFSTYAVPLIAGEIKRFLRDDGMVKVSRSIKENAYKVYQAKENLTKALGREVSLSELAAATDMSREDMLTAMEAGADVESLQETYSYGDGREISLEEKLADDRDDHEVMLNSMLVEELLEALPEEDCRLIRMRYFEECTQVETAKRLGVSQVQVSRMEKKILKSMRHMTQN